MSKYPGLSRIIQMAAKKNGWDEQKTAELESALTEACDRAGMAFVQSGALAAQTAAKIIQGNMTGCMPLEELLKNPICDAGIQSCGNGLYRYVAYEKLSE